MLAIDHGYFQGPTTGLERVDINILPLAPYADTLMLTRGILRSIVPPSYHTTDCSQGFRWNSILKELSNEGSPLILRSPYVSTFVPWQCRSLSAANMKRNPLST